MHIDTDENVKVPLPDRIVPTDLDTFGFIRLSVGRAKHVKWQSWRNECSGCGIWCKQITNDRCKECRRHESLNYGRLGTANFLIENRPELGGRHYIIASDKHPLRWASFTIRKVETYQKTFGNQFCLVTTKASAELDCFVFPFWELEQLFTPKNVYEDRAWSIYINHGKVWFHGVEGHVFDATKYYNAIEYLEIDYSEAKPPALSSQTMETLLHEADITAQIAKFNAAYVDVAPTRRVIVSQLIERPGQITEYLKRLHDYTCQLCKTQDFEQVGGSLYIEARHLVELHSEIPGSYCSDNIIIVCANCHRKLHYASARSSDTSHNPLGLADEEWARISRTYTLSAAYFLAKLYEAKQKPLTNRRRT